MHYGAGGLFGFNLLLFYFWTTFGFVVKWVNQKYQFFSAKRSETNKWGICYIVRSSAVQYNNTCVIKLKFIPYHHNHTVGSVLASKAPISSLSATMLSSQVQARRNFSLLLWLLFLSSGTSLTMALKLSEIWSLRFCSDSM